MIEEQKMISVTVSELSQHVAVMAKDGYRLVQIGCTKLADKLEVNYSFDKDYRFVNIRVELPLDKPSLPSVSKIYMPAFLYENEMHDLFGVEVKDMILDYKGNFYRVAVKAPFNPQKKEG